MLVILNPIARGAGGPLWPAVCAALADRGCDVTIRTTAAAGEGTRLAAAARAADYDVVAIAGGDGTINEVVNGLPDDPAMVAVVPLGTANVVALEIGLRATAAAIAGTIAAGRPMRVHLGRVNGRAFVMMAGAGFDAAVVAGVDPGRKRRLGRWAYVLETVRQLFRHRARPLAVTVDGVRHTAASVVVGNGHYYGGRFVCTPDARLGQPGFQVCLARGAGRLSVLRYGLALALGALARMPDVTLVRGTRVRIDGPAGAPVQADGDIVARLPAEIEVAPRVLYLLMP